MKQLHETSIRYVEALNKNDTAPIIVVGGWGTNIDSYQTTIKTLAELGRDSYTIATHRIGKNRRNTDSLAPEILENKALTINELLQKLGGQGIEEIDIIAHSEGGITATVAALLHARIKESPKIHSLTLVTPAGLNGPDTAIRVGGSFITQGFRSASLEPNHYRKSKTASAFTKPITALRELMAIASTNTLPLLTELHNDYNIHINVITGQHDPVFPTRRIQKTIANSPFIQFQELDIRHNGIVIHPEQVVPIVLTMIKK
jgi:pimeloyl-ACP methyl ester carboxylesterase